MDGLLNRPTTHRPRGLHLQKQTQIAMSILNLLITSCEFHENTVVLANKMISQNTTLIRKHSRESQRKTMCSICFVIRTLLSKPVLLSTVPVCLLTVYGVQKNVSGTVIGTTTGEG